MTTGASIKAVSQPAHIASQVFAAEQKEALLSEEAEDKAGKMAEAVVFKVLESVEASRKKFSGTLVTKRN